jgi:hypothetical protein
MRGKDGGGVEEEIWSWRAQPHPGAQNPWWGTPSSAALRGLELVLLRRYRVASIARGYFSVYAPVHGDHKLPGIEILHQYCADKMLHLQK